MTRFARIFLAGLFAVAAGPPLAASPARAAYSQPELEQMLAPVALYPDALLSQILMASTYPSEVLEAAQWSREHPGWQGDAAVQSVQDRDWDPSVKSLVAFPNVLARMAENYAWMQALGDAFIAQEPQVMEAVQALRRRARAAGQLSSNERYVVYEDVQSVTIVPASPQTVYVPYYDPRVVYGLWWWDAYPPVVWAPWPGYVPAHRPGLSAGFWWGAPVGISVGFFFGNIDWVHRHVRVVHVNNFYVRPAPVRRTVALLPGRWRHDPWHRRGLPYRDPSVQSRFSAPAPLNTQRGEEWRRNPAVPRAAAPRVDPPAVTSPRIDEPRTERRRREAARLETQRFDTRSAPPPAEVRREAAPRPALQRPAEPPRRAEQRPETRPQHAAPANQPLAVTGAAPAPRAEPAPPKRAARQANGDERRAERAQTGIRDRPMPLR